MATKQFNAAMQIINIMIIELKTPTVHDESDYCEDYVKTIKGVHFKMSLLAICTSRGYISDAIKR